MKRTFSIRPLERSDTEQLRALLATRDDTDADRVKQRLALVQWAAFHNPRANDEPTYFVADQDGKLIGHVGRMPNVFSVNGQRVNGYFVHDLYVHPEHRGGGKGLSLSVAFYKTTREQSDSFCALLWTTQLNLQIQRRLGYAESYLQNYVKVLRVEPVLRKFVSHGLLTRILSYLPNLFFHAVDAIRLRSAGKDLQIVSITRFDERFDQLSQRISSRLGIHSVKSADNLNWRYIDRPYPTNRIFAALKGNELTGFIVVTLDKKQEFSAASGTIIDIMSDPDDRDTASALIAAAVRCCRESGVEIIQCIMTQPEFAAILTKYLFLSRESWRHPLMLGNVEKCTIDERILTDQKHWHITKGESDGFIFS